VTGGTVILYVIGAAIVLVSGGLIADPKFRQRIFKHTPPNSFGIYLCVVVGILLLIMGLQMNFNGEFSSPCAIPTPTPFPKDKLTLEVTDQRWGDKVTTSWNIHIPKSDKLFNSHIKLDKEGHLRFNYYEGKGGHLIVKCGDHSIDYYIPLDYRAYYFIPESPKAVKDENRNDIHCPRSTEIEFQAVEEDLVIHVEQNRGQ
jgi:hypothetical protein